MPIIRLKNWLCPAIISCAISLSGCDLLDTHPYDANVDGACDINSRNMEQIEKNCAGRNEMRFAVISDTQRWYDETADLVKNINKRGDIDFVIHCGDLTDFGVTKEFEWMRRELEKFDMPYVCLLGNHDCLGNGIVVYRKMFGDENFSFTAGDTHFVCLNTNGLEFDYSEPVPDFQFIKHDQEAINSDTTIRRTVVAMHAMPNSDQFSENLAELFQQEIMRYPGLDFCLCGHDHTTSIEYPFNDNFPYYRCGAAKKRSYFVITLTKDGDSVYEKVDF